ncbi:hypothetical protein ACFXKG_18605 [Streptomyces sp. NPDC059255]|uniref:hypothetical protein n=1 Tax=Streptomyces sp. NPDC059255 TaxID=3346793 RepID=UPI0036A9942F
MTDDTPPSTSRRRPSTSASPAPAEQVADIERLLARRDDGTPLGRLTAELVATMMAFERKEAAAMRRPHSDDLLDNSGLLGLARDYAHAVTPEQRDQLAAEIADRLTIDEAGVILRAATAIKTALPRIILRAKENQDTTAEIARELGMTDSYVRRLIREHVQYSWRLDLYDSEAGPGWQRWETGGDLVPAERTVTDFAEHILRAAGRGPREHRARVLVWNDTHDQSDEAAIYTHEQNPTG